MGSSPLSSKVSSKDRACHPTRVKKCTAGCAFPFAHARRFLERWATGESGRHCHCGATGVIGAFGDDSLCRQGHPFQRGVPYKLMRLPGFGLKVWLLMRKGSAVSLTCPRSYSQVGLPSDCDLGLGIWYLEHVGERGRKVAGRRSRRSDRGVDDRRPKCEDG